jgi:hypothetical protein
MKVSIPKPLAHSLIAELSKSKRRDVQISSWYSDE